METKEAELFTETDPTALEWTELESCTGSENRYRHYLGLEYTDGVKIMAEKGKAYWLIDAIASYQASKKFRRDPMLAEFQIWTLKVNPDKSAVLKCERDTGDPKPIVQRIEYTDFPLPEFKLYVEGRVILLPSEH